MNRDDDLLLKLPDKNKIPCLNCKYGLLDYLCIKCQKYPECKPKEVYYDNQPCPKQEKIVK